MLCKYNAGSNYNRTGQWCIAKYQEQSWVTGIIQDSRIKHGGSIQHTIVSDTVTYVGEDIRNAGTTFLVLENHLSNCETLHEG